MNSLKYRMYGLVPYNISPIQQGIQFGHGVVEFMREYKGLGELNDWADYDKTFIILNGGTTNMGYQGQDKGTLNQHLDELILNNIRYSCFFEPDLGGQLTSVNFLVDERVWDKEKYPDFVGSGLIGNSGDYDRGREYVIRLGGEKNAFLREFLSTFRLA